MTNNHCPKTPAVLNHTRVEEIAILEFSQKLSDTITEFVQQFAIDSGIKVHPSIFHNWTECTNCERKVLDIADKADENIRKSILNYLTENI